MSEDESVEAGRHTAQAFKALLSAALVVADAQRQRAVREMRRLESEARDREQEALRRGRADTALTPSPGEPFRSPGTGPGAAPGVEDPVTLAKRWAAAQQPGADPAERVDLDKRVAAAGVDPQQVRDEHAAAPGGEQPSETGHADVEPAGRTADTIQREGVWQDGSPEVARAGLSYTRTPGSRVTPGLSPQRRSTSPGRAVAKIHDLGR